jgi:hypothetical protein
MTRVDTVRIRGSAGRLRVVALAILLLAALLLLAPGPGSAGAGVPIKGGKYSGQTTQAGVAAAYRTIQFTVKKGKFTLTTEPAVARENCVSAPVFTLDGTASKKLGKGRTFTFTRTFLGSRFDTIHGTFVSANEVEGYAIYYFSAQDQCSEGSSKVDFTAKHK